MGSKYTIYSYRRTYRPVDKDKRTHVYVEVWRGQWLLKALLVIIAQRLDGARCLRLEYRP